MDNDRIETAKKSCVDVLIDYLMEWQDWTQAQADAYLKQTKLYQMIMDEETWMYLESWEYLRVCCKLEMEQGEKALYAFISSEDPDKPAESIIQTALSLYHHLVR